MQAIRLLDRPTLVYNFTVAEVHSYFVGEGRWWVHNAPCGGVRLHADAQGKHIPGHKNYLPGRSILTHPDPQALLDEFAGTGNPLRGTPGQPGYKEWVNFGKIIGRYIDELTGKAFETTNGVIHYSSKGAHIVPARP